MRRFDRFTAAALGFYSGLAFILLHPLIVYNGTRVAGFDFFNYNWNFWWIRHALTTPGLNVYQTDFVFFPQSVNFGYHALTAFWYPLWALIEPLAGTLTAVNAIIFTGCVLNGFVLFVWMRSEGIKPALALIGGAALQALPISRYFYYNTHLNLMDWFWLPAMLLLWKQIALNAERSRGRAALTWAAILGLAIWGLGLTDLQFPIFAAFVVVPYGLWTLWRSPARLRLVAFGLVAVTIGGGLLWFAGPLPHMARFTGTLAPGPAEERPGVPFPSGFFSMNAEWWEWSKPSLGAFVTTALLIVLVAWAAVRPFARGKAPRLRTVPLFWLITAIPPFVLALGADFHIGDLTIPLPFRLLHAQTNGMFRMPWRLAPIFVIAALMLCGQVGSARVIGLNTALLRRPVLAGLIGVILFLAVSVRLFETGPLQAAPVEYQAYRAMGVERGADYDSYMVLEVPTGTGTGEVLLGDARAIQLQYYGMIHEKRMLNGFVSRAPLDPLWAVYTLDPLWAWLGQRVPLDTPAAAALLAERVFAYPIGYIVIHTDIIGAQSAALSETVAFFNAQHASVCPPFTEGAIIVYRTRAHPDGCDPRTPPETEPGAFRIDIGANDTAYLGQGWHWREAIFDMSIRWMGAAPQTDLVFDLPPGAYQVTVTAQAFAQPRTMTLLLNGTQLGESFTAVPEQFQVFTVPVPRDVIGNGEHLTLTFAYDDVLIPVEIGQSADERPLAIMIDTVTFTQIPEGR
ncbi:MAG: hypothetical protein SF162_14955 [bacterium]|nr:hypothetical protein [bacterium]